MRLQFTLLSRKAEMPDNMAKAGCNTLILIALCTGAALMAGGCKKKAVDPYEPMVPSIDEATLERLQAGGQAEPEPELEPAPEFQTRDIPDFKKGCTAGKQLWKVEYRNEPSSPVLLK